MKISSKWPIRDEQNFNEILIVSEIELVSFWFDPKLLLVPYALKFYQNCPINKPFSTFDIFHISSSVTLNITWIKFELISWCFLWKYCTLKTVQFVFQIGFLRLNMCKLDCTTHLNFKDSQKFHYLSNFRMQ